ncbi:MAG: hypothetical protein ABSD86_24670, partial [Candidatus Sulfotelmatobacter sp.]
MPVRKISTSLFLFSAVVIGAVSQDAPPNVVGGQLASLAEQLKQHHIELTEAGLLKALRSPD